MTFSLATRLAAEFFGTAIMIILGNGSVADVELKGTKGTKSGWITISVGYGFAVMIPALMFGSVSGNHINPAFTLGLAFAGAFPWHEVLPYIAAQLIGAAVGQLVVWICFKPRILWNVYLGLRCSCNHARANLRTRQPRRRLHRHRPFGNGYRYFVRWPDRSCVEPCS